RLRVSEAYDDNLFLAKKNRKEDYITTISPSVLFSVTSKYIAFDMNYVMDYKNYQNNSRQSGTSHVLLTYIRPGSLALPFKKRGGKIGIEIQEDFQPFVTSVATSEQTERTDRTYNKFFSAIDYYISEKRTLALEYTNIYMHYRTSTLRNYSYTENNISPTFYFHIRPKWSLFTGYSYGIFDYSKGAGDSTYHQIRSGVTGTLFTKVLAHLEIGKRWRTYKESENGEAQVLFLKTALLDKFTPSTTGTLQYNRIDEDSVHTNNPYYISDAVSFNLEHKFTYKTTGILGIKYIHNDYERDTTIDEVTKKREDNIWQPQLGLRYQFRKWLSADLNYTHQNRTSNFDKYNYVDNCIMSGINAQF
ncbi:MAG: outer membrane beta-barrel protein, partial [Candidatus Omnitrophica bacterium]|nr:outer membrane beta-barrel protein [Candidatus Omnitrophota bacterium]